MNRCCWEESGSRCASTAVHAVQLLVGNAEHTLTEWQITADRTQLLGVCDEHRQVDPRLLLEKLRRLVRVFREKTSSEPDANLCGIVLKPIEGDEARAALLALRTSMPSLATTDAPIPVDVARERDLSPGERAALRGALPCVGCGKYPEVENHTLPCPYRGK